MLQIPAKLYRIGELVRHTPFSRQTIHNYTIMGLIREAEWTRGGHRLYGESVFQRLSLISRLKKTNTLTQIREILRKQDTRSVAGPQEGQGHASEESAPTRTPSRQHGTGDDMVDTS